MERFSSFTFLISNISRHIRKIKSVEVAELDLKGPHVTCLYYINKSKALTAKELCVLCGEDKGAISRSLEYLETKGFITSLPIDGKKYKTPLSLTEKGQEASNVICQKIDSVLDRVAEGVSEEHRLIMYSALEKINDNLKSICNDYND